MQYFTIHSSTILYSSSLYHPLFYITIRSYSIPSSSPLQSILSLPNALSITLCYFLLPIVTLSSTILSSTIHPLPPKCSFYNTLLFFAPHRPPLLYNSFLYNPSSPSQMLFL